jgi:hypothetical protein
MSVQLYGGVSQGAYSALDPYSQNPYPALPGGESLVDPSYGNMSGGSSFGGGSTGYIGTQIPGMAYGGGGGTDTMTMPGFNSYQVPRETSIYAQPTAAPAAQTVSAPAASPVPFPSAPAQDTAAPTPAAPVATPTPAASPVTPSGPSIGSASSSAASNPYANPGFSAPSNPLAFAQMSAQLQSNPVSPSAGQAPGIEQGGGAPINPMMFAGGIHGSGMPMQSPPLNPPAPRPIPFGAVASRLGNAIPAPAAGTTGPLTPGQQSVGQALSQEVPAPPKAENLQNAPPPIGNLLGKPVGGVPQKPQVAPVPTPTTKLDATTLQILKQLENNGNRAIANDAALKTFIKTQQKQLDKASVQFMFQQLAGPQKIVDSFETAQPGGISQIQFADGLLNDARVARNMQRAILNGDFNAHFNAQAAIDLKGARAANTPMPGMPEAKGEWAQKQLAGQQDLAQREIAQAKAIASLNAYRTAEGDALKKQQDILNGYHAALVARAKAGSDAYDEISKRQDAFWKVVDQIRESDKFITGAVNDEIKVWSDLQKAQQNDDYRNAALKLSAEANNINALKANNDIAERSDALKQSTLSKLRDSYEKLTKPVKGLDATGKGLRAEAAEAIKAQIEGLEARK